MLLKRSFAASELGTLLIQPSGKSFGGHKALIHCREFGTARGNFILFRLDGLAKLDERLRKSHAFGIGIGAAQRGGGMLVLRALGTVPRAFHFLADARQFVL